MSLFPDIRTGGGESGEEDIEIDEKSRSSSTDKTQISSSDGVVKVRNLKEYQLLRGTQENLTILRESACISVNESDRESSGSGLPLVSREFQNLIRSDADIAVAVAAVAALTKVLEASRASTMMEVKEELDRAVESLKQFSNAISLVSGCALYMRFVTRSALGYANESGNEGFERFKKRLIERGEQFTYVSKKSRMTIAITLNPFLPEDVTCLTHGYSRVVLAALFESSKKKRITVICTESRPDDAGYAMASRLTEKGVKVNMVLDCAVASIIEKVDLVLVGAEAVVENGGIINKIGTYQIALAAKEFAKPFYVAAESYKFSRIYPLGQSDLPPSTRENKMSSFSMVRMPEGCGILAPNCDYTPPQLISLLFSDLGVLTPSAVSDELIKLYV